MTAESKEKTLENTKGKKDNADKKDESKDTHSEGSCCGVCGG